MKKFLLTSILSAGALVASAEEPVQGIIATYEGAETSYKLEDVPAVKYETVDGVLHAVLSLKGVTEPVLSVALSEGKQLMVIYGEYESDITGIEGAAASKATISEQNGKKIVSGGKLIVVGKDGKMYDTAGKLM